MLRSRKWNLEEIWGSRQANGPVSARQTILYMYSVITFLPWACLDDDDDDGDEDFVLIIFQLY